MFSGASQSFCESKLEVPSLSQMSASARHVYYSSTLLKKKCIFLRVVQKFAKLMYTNANSFTDTSVSIPQTHSLYSCCVHECANNPLSSLHLRGACRPHTRYLPIFELIVANVANEHVTRCMGDHLSARARKLTLLPCFCWQPWYLSKHQSMWKQSCVGSDLPSPGILNKYIRYYKIL